jgi:hypothetical protein
MDVTSIATAVSSVIGAVTNGTAAIIKAKNTDKSTTNNYYYNNNKESSGILHNPYILYGGFAFIAIILTLILLKK